MMGHADIGLRSTHNTRGFYWIKEIWGSAPANLILEGQEYMTLPCREVDKARTFEPEKHILVIHKSGYNDFQSMVIVKDKIHVKGM